MFKYFRCSASKEIQRFVYNGTNLSPVWSRMNAAQYLWWSTHKPTTVSLAYHLMKEHPTTRTVIVTFAFRILFWLLLLLCSHGVYAGQQKEIFPGELPSFRRLQQTHPGQGAREQKWLKWTSLLSDLWWSMSHFFPFGAVSGNLGLENSFFLGRQG